MAPARRGRQHHRRPAAARKPPDSQCRPGVPLPRLPLRGVAQEPQPDRLDPHHPAEFSLLDRFPPERKPV
ncbi:hypothetical protein MTBLM5_420021 [Magnetospirillum sp. LM-5]|nr:hypothetical protein MTBLM5_420021 [Magnetospirillum sp. LM-5]